MEFLAGNEKRFAEFISKLTDKDKIAILAHNDGDSVCSAIMASRILGEIDYINFLDYKHGMFKLIAPELKKRKINKIIIMDLSVDSEIENIKELEKFAELFIIDHHVFLNDLNSDKTVFIKTESKFPASYVCYKLFSKIQKIPSWIAVIGTLSDMSYHYTKETADKIFDDFDFEGERKNLINEVMILGGAIIYFRGNEKEVFDITKNMKSSEEIKELEKFSKIVDKEIDYFLEMFKKNHEEYKDLIWYYFKPRFAITSALSTKVSLENEDKTIVLVVEFEGLLRISSRRQDKKVDCVKLLQESIKGIPDSNAGGHVAAAGGRIPIRYLNKFKENLFKVYNTLR